MSEEGRQDAQPTSQTRTHPSASPHILKGAESLAGEPSAAGAHSAQPAPLSPSALQGQTAAAHESFCQDTSGRLGAEYPYFTCCLQGQAALHKHTTLLSTIHNQASVHCCRRMLSTSAPSSPSATPSRTAWAHAAISHAANHEQQLNALQPLLSAQSAHDSEA